MKRARVLESKNSKLQKINHRPRKEKREMLSKIRFQAKESRRGTWLGLGLGLGLGLVLCPQSLYFPHPEIAFSRQLRSGESEISPSFDTCYEGEIAVGDTCIIASGLLQ